VTLENLLVHAHQRVASQPLNPQALLRLNDEGHLVLVFDGFDEILGYSEPSRFLQNLRQLLRAARGKAKVILTCRTHYFRDQPEEIHFLNEKPDDLSTPGATRLYEEIRERPGAEIGYLREFSEEQIVEYLGKALGDGAGAFRDQIRQTYHLEDLAERPFLLELIVKTLPSLLQRGERTDLSVADLYEAYCGRWLDDPRLQLTREHRSALVEDLACFLWNSDEQKVHYTTLAERSLAFYGDRAMTVIEKEQVDYEVRTALFLHRDPTGHYSFIHRSFLELFVARTIRQGVRNGDRRCFDLRPLTREVAFFLEQWQEEAGRIPDLASDVLAEAYVPRVSENPLLPCASAGASPGGTGRGEAGYGGRRRPHP